MSGSDISWAVCKSAPRSRQITTPASHHSVFYRPDALPAAKTTASKHWGQYTNKINVVKLGHCFVFVFLYSRQHPTPTTQFFTGRMPFLSPNLQRQSTEGAEESYSTLVLEKRSARNKHELWHRMRPQLLWGGRLSTGQQCKSLSVKLRESGAQLHTTDCDNSYQTYCVQYLLIFKTLHNYRVAR